MTSSFVSFFYSLFQKCVCACNTEYTIYPTYILSIYIGLSILFCFPSISYLSLLYFIWLAFLFDFIFIAYIACASMCIFVYMICYVISKTGVSLPQIFLFCRKIYTLFHMWCWCAVYWSFHCFGVYFFYLLGNDNHRRLFLTHRFIFIYFFFGFYCWFQNSFMCTISKQWSWFLAMKSIKPTKLFNHLLVFPIGYEPFRFK